MASRKEQFFDANSFAVIGNSRTKGFPKLTYKYLRTMGKTVYAVDLGGGATVEGDPAYPSVDDLPGEVEAAIIEVPRGKTMDALRPVVEAGIKRVWFHQKSDTPAVASYCRDEALDFHVGGCAVMYTHNRLSYHSVHKRLWKLLGKY
jgi:predicted CoA-binding protein